VSDGQWACIRRDEIAIHDWPDGSVIFDDANGRLHCLSPVSGNLMGLLVGLESWSASGLAQELLGEEPTAHDVEMVENVLSEFSSLNLIERVAA
jgi:hypothetical protein